MKLLHGALCLLVSISGAVAGEAPSSGENVQGGHAFHWSPESAAAASTPVLVLFPDPALEAAVRAAVGIPSAPLLSTDLVGTGFTTLDAVNRGITNLAGLSSCSDLTWLRLGDNNITNLSEIAALPNLKRLFLGRNHISDISPLSGLTGLMHLELWDNEITNLTPLSSLVNLRSLNVSNNPIGNIAPLGGPSRLRALYIHGGAVADISPMAGLTSLVNVGMVDNLIQNIAPLAGLTKLANLEVSDNLIVNISALELNPGLGGGDVVSLERNPLSQGALCSSIPALQARDVTVQATGSCGAPIDSDGDGLSDVEENQRGTNPLLADTDGDGLSDGNEVSRGTNPLVADTDGDGLADADEVSRNTNPLLIDTDGDGIPDGTEVDAGTSPTNNASFLPEVYVDGASGSDAAGFGTRTRPWATVAHAAALVKGSPAHTVSIRVAKGTYTRLDKVRGPLQLNSHEHLFGGYEASGWTRDTKANPTILDASLAWEGHPSPNTVVFENIVNAVLDGFTVTGANSVGSSYADGAGILGKGLDASSSVKNCLITNNSANKLGGGGILLVNANMTVSACTIAENYSDGTGGGIGITGTSRPVIDRCTIAANLGAGGGGVAIRQSANALIVNSVVSGNALTGKPFDLPWGGGILVHVGTATIVNCTITHNESAQRGGGVAVRTNTPPHILNSIFSGNRNSAIADYWEVAVTVLENCLFDGNPEGDYYRYNNGAHTTRNGAAAINANVAGARGNVSGTARFNMSPAGAWTAAPIYRSTTLRTTFTDSTAPFTPGALRGKIIAPSPDSSLQALVLDNTASTVEVLADYSAFVTAGGAYRIVDYRLQLGSAAIDTGFNTSAPANGAVAADFNGIARGFDGDGLGRVTGDGSDYDIGAFESNLTSAAITVLSPNGGETFSRGLLNEIRWNSSGNVGGNVKIVVRKGTYSGILAGSTPNDGSYFWLVPATYPLGPGMTIEISSITTPSIVDSSNAAFSIGDPAPVPPANRITVVSPNGGESYIRGTMMEIKWTSTGTVGSNVKIVARKGSYSGILAGGTPNDGSYLWSIPATYPIGADWTIEISSLATPDIIDSGNGPFTIAP